MATIAGGRLTTNAHSKTDASFVMAANSNKIKNAIPMYAFTLSTWQIPIPVSVKKSKENTISSLLSRHFNSLPSNALMATEKLLANRKMSAANKNFWERVFSWKGRWKGVG